MKKTSWEACKVEESPDDPSGGAACGCVASAVGFAGCI